jgi:NRPS condensation-like uncharacterized protein
MTHFGIGFPAWKESPGLSEVVVNINTHDGECVPEAALQLSLNPYNGPPIDISAYYLKGNKTAIVFTFCHILFDFSGVQAYIFSLAGLLESNGISIHSDKGNRIGKWRLFFKAVSFVFSRGTVAMQTTRSRIPAKRPVKLKYDLVSFDAVQTDRIQQSIARNGLSFLPSAYFSAVVAKALNDELFKISNESSFLWIPIPVSNRKKENAGILLGNHLSFLFLRLFKSDLSSKRTALDSVKEQMFKSINEKIPDSLAVFCRNYKLMPLPFYYPMLQLPSLGKMSSFSFSMLEEVFPGMQSFMGHKVLQIENHPSNTIQPGITFLFYRLDDKINLSISWLDGQYESKIQLAVADRIKNLLMED